MTCFWHHAPPSAAPAAAFPVQPPSTLFLAPPHPSPITLLNPTAPSNPAPLPLPPSASTSPSTPPLTPFPPSTSASQSGAGKTESCRAVVQYLAYHSRHETGELSAAILAANPVLEAFGNCKTARNNVRDEPSNLASA